MTFRPGHPALRVPLPGGGPTSGDWAAVRWIAGPVGSPASPGLLAGLPILLADPEAWLAQVDDDEIAAPLEDLPFAGLAALARYLPGLAEPDAPLVRALGRALALAPTGAGLGVDIGCSIGRDVRALRAVSSHVIAFDTYLPALRAARAQLAGEPVPWPVRVEGRRFRMEDARVFPPCDGVTLVVGDAMDPPLRPEVADVVLAVNVIDNVPRPRLVLSQIDAITRPGGLAVIASPFAWHDGITPPEAQLGGAPLEGLPDEGSPAMLGDLLGPGWDIVHREDVPWVLRDHARATFHYDVHVIAARKRAAAP